MDHLIPEGRVHHLSGELQVSQKDNSLNRVRRCSPPHGKPPSPDLAEFPDTPVPLSFTPRFLDISGLSFLMIDCFGYEKRSHTTHSLSRPAPGHNIPFSLIPMRDETGNPSGTWGNRIPPHYLGCRKNRSCISNPTPPGTHFSLHRLPRTRLPRTPHKLASPEHLSQLAGSPLHRNPCPAHLWRIDPPVPE